MHTLSAFFIACAVVSLSGIGIMLAVPSVRDAQSRVSELVHSHNGEVAVLPLPYKLAAAVISVEDRYFYSSAIVNITYGAARACLVGLLRGGDPGGSTIEQQLARQLYQHDAGFRGKVEAIALGFKLSLIYSKSQILGMYLNAVYFGHGYWGYAAAARGYFGVAPDGLSWAQATLLAGLLQSPSLYDPFLHPKSATRRQEHVITRLVDNHYISTSQAAAISAEPLVLKGSRPAQ